MFLAPATFVAVFELTRLRVDGPMVDGIHASFYGAIALITGRGFHALLALLPMALGAAVGAGAARARTGPTRRDASRRCGTSRCGAPALRSSAWHSSPLMAGLARPATTAPITGPDGEPVAGSVAELTTVDVGGHDLGLHDPWHAASTTRCCSSLPEGPEAPSSGAMRRHLPALEEHFTVATWDQRGCRHVLRRT